MALAAALASLLLDSDTRTVLGPHTDLSAPGQHLAFGDHGA
jgi:hypothetical protein